MSVYKFRGSWRAEVWLGSKRIMTKCGFQTKADAKKWRETKLAGFHTGQETVTKSPASIRTMEELINKYVSDHLPTIKVGTRRRYIIDIQHRIRPFFNFFKLSSINKSLIEEFRSKVINEGVSAKTVNNCMSVLRGIFSKAVDWEWMERNPFHLKALKGVERPYRWWDSREHIHKFIEGAKGHRYYAAFLLALECGMRLGEIVGLSKQDVSFDLCTIKIHRQWLDKDHCYGPTKNGKSRYVRFMPGSNLELALKTAIESSPHPEAIFVTRTGNRVGCRKLSAESFGSLVKKLGLPPITFHELRHTFASWYMIEVGDVWSLMSILGHANVQITMKYAHVSGQHQKVPDFSWNRASSPHNSLTGGVVTTLKLLISLRKRGAASTELSLERLAELSFLLSPFERCPQSCPMSSLSRSVSHMKPLFKHCSVWTQGFPQRHNKGASGLLAFPPSNALCNHDHFLSLNVSCCKCSQQRATSNLKFSPIKKVKGSCRN